MKKSLLAVIGAALLALGTTGVSQALQMTFFGENVGPGDPNVPLSGPLPAHLNADDAQAAFLAFLPGVGMEGFDGFPSSTPAPLTVSFAQPSGPVTATLSGLTGFVQTDPVGRGAGQFPISAPNYWFSAFLPPLPPPLNILNFSLEFSAPQVAFGFFGVDIGDGLGGVQASLELGLLSGGTLSMDIPHTIGTTGTTGGSVLYFGRIDTVNLFTKVTFLSTVGSDGFGFDNFTIASASQVIPEPNTFLLLGSGLAIGGFGLWRQRRTASR